MWRTFSVLVFVVLVLGLVGSAPAVTYYWSGGGGDDSWCTSGNWTPPAPVGGPGPVDDEVFMDARVERGPVIAPGCEADVWRVWGPCYESNNDQIMDIIDSNMTVRNWWRWDHSDHKQARGTGTLNITGKANLTVAESPEYGGAIRALDRGSSIINISANENGEPNVWIVRGGISGADEDEGYMEWNMSAGLVRSRFLAFGDNGGGVFNMTGGTILLLRQFTMRGRHGADFGFNMSGGYVKCDYYGVPTDADANLVMYFDGGIIDCNVFSPNPDSNWVADISGGQIRITGDHVQKVTDEYIPLGKMIAYHGDPEAEIDVYWDPILDKTIITAAWKGKATNPSPAHGQGDICPDDITLTWTQARQVVDHNIYFGDSVGDVDPNASPLVTHHGPNTWTIPYQLELDKKYYWRIDGINDACEASPWVGSVWVFHTQDGNAYDPSPSNNQTVVPLDAKLSWTPGCVITGHDVYFGMDYEDVRDATTAFDPNGAYQGRLPAGTTEFDPCGFDYFTWYYWRIDEVNDAEIRRGEVWSFRSQSAIFDPNLLVWYKFDEKDPNTSTHDHSGHERHLGVGGGHWDPNDGFEGGSLVFDNDMGPAIPLDVLAPVSSANTPAITVAVWVNGDPDHDYDGTKDMSIFDGGDDSGALLEGDCKLTGLVPSEDGDVVWRAGNDTNDVLYWREASPSGWEGDWHHFAFTKDAATMTIYFDGIVAKSTTEANSATLANFAGKTFKLGAYTDHSSDYEGKLDDFRIYDYALSPDQVAALFRGADLTSAWGPMPSDGQTQVAWDTDLSWRPGNHANKHDVYFGTSFDDVNDADTTTLVIYKGRQNLEANSYDPGLLELETTYYWRIDEVNDANGDIWTGKVWRFTIAEYIVVDDMESYDAGGSGNLIYDTWDDGFNNWTGSQLELSYANPDLFYTGKQGMRYTYNNNLVGAPKYSEIDANTTGPRPGNLKVGKDWTGHDVRLLRLWFRGTSGNALEQMYMALEDTAGPVVVVNYGDYGEDLADITTEQWRDWTMLLPDFAASGVDLQDVTKVRIGFGDRDNPQVGGSGTVFFDDIRLYPPICIPELGPAADFSGNCIVDLADVAAMAEQWLRTDVAFDVVEEPNAPIGRWKLEGNALDSSVNANDGIMEGSYSWVDGYIDVNAVEFSGGGGRLLVADDGDTPELRPQHEVSASAWVNYGQDQGHSARVVVKGADNSETFSIEVDETDHLVFQVRDPNGDRYAVASDDLPWNEWVHLAGTFDGTWVRCYVNGELADSSDEAGGITLSQDTSGLAIGNRSDATDREFIGIIDDVRVYDYGLSAAEVAHVATQGSGKLQLGSQVNLYKKEPVGEGAINFRDYAELMESWLEEKLWPE